MAVIGASGSGKSSVVFAGLIPQLRSEEGWLIEAFRPGYRPFRNLAARLVPQLETEMSETDQLVEVNKQAKALQQEDLGLQDVVTRVLEKNSGSRLLLIADQFEEIYTLCQDNSERQLFLDHRILTISEKNEDSVLEDKVWHLWDINGTKIKELKFNSIYYTVVGFSDSGDKIFIGNSKIFQLWDRDGILLKETNDFTDSIQFLYFGVDDNKLVTIDQNGMTRIGNKDLKLIKEFNVEKLYKAGSENDDLSYTAQLMKDGKVLVSGPSFISLWDTHGNLLWSTNIDFQDYTVPKIMGNHILIRVCTERGRGATAGSLRRCYDSMAQLWDLEGNLLNSLDPQSEEEEIIRFTRFNLKGNRILTVNAQGTMRLWDSAGNLIIKLQGKGTSADFHPDGKRLVTINQGGILQFWEIWSDLESMVKEAKRRAGRNLTNKECQDYLHQAQCLQNLD